ncbi:hypothetical protein ACY2DA_00485 [Staphylococcus simulans]
MRKNILWLLPLLTFYGLWKRLLKQRHQVFSEVDIETPEDVDDK